MNEKTISIAVPCYNEESNVPEFYNEILKIFTGINYGLEIVFVNDGSKDNTLGVLVSLNSKDNRVKVVNLSRNFGKEIALAAAIDYCTGEAVIPMDVDLQDPPSILVELIKKWEEGFDVVYATRRKRNGEGLFKKFTAFVFYRLINSMSRIEIPKDTGDFRLMDRKVINALKKIKEYHRFMKGLFTWVGFRQTQIMYDRPARFTGKTKFNFWKLFNLAIEGVTSFSVAPLRIATIMGLLVSLSAFIYAFFIILDTLIYGNSVPGYPSLIVLILFLGGGQLLSIGIIGEYVGRIFDETKNRPLYFVKEEFGF